MAKYQVLGRETKWTQVRGIQDSNKKGGMILEDYNNELINKNVTDIIYCQWPVFASRFTFGVVSSYYIPSLLPTQFLIIGSLF